MANGMSKFTPSSAIPSSRDGPDDAGRFRRRRTLLIVASTLGGVALMLGWYGLFLATIPPLLLSVLPCVVMCAFGLCMAGRRDKACRESMEVDAGNSEPVPSESTDRYARSKV